MQNTRDRIIHGDKSLNREKNEFANCHQSSIGLGVDSVRAGHINNPSVKWMKWLVGCFLLFPSSLWMHSPSQSEMHVVKVTHFL